MQGALDIKVQNADELLHILRQHSEWAAPARPQTAREALGVRISTSSSPRESSASLQPRSHDVTKPSEDHAKMMRYYPFKNPMKVMPSLAKSASTLVVSNTCPTVLLNVPNEAPIPINSRIKLQGTSTLPSNNSPSSASALAAKQQHVHHDGLQAIAGYQGYSADVPSSGVVADYPPNANIPASGTYLHKAAKRVTIEEHAGRVASRVAAPQHTHKSDMDVSAEASRKDCDDRNSSTGTNNAVNHGFHDLGQKRQNNDALDGHVLSSNDNSMMQNKVAHATSNLKVVTTELQLQGTRPKEAREIGKSAMQGTGLEMQYTGSSRGLHELHREASAETCRKLAAAVRPLCK